MKRGTPKAMTFYDLTNPNISYGICQYSFLSGKHTKICSSYDLDVVKSQFNKLNKLNDCMILYTARKRRKTGTIKKKYWIIKGFN